MVQTEQLKRPQRVEEAIEHALASRWDAAAKANRALLKEQPDDVGTANRLGKALTELQDYAGAIKAYAKAMSADPTNTIARKNLDRLHDLRGESKPKPGKVKKRPADRQATIDARTHSLVEEFGKSAEFELLELNAAALKPLTAGDAAAVRPVDGGVEITTPDGELLGTIDRRAATRLKRMIEGGNEYVIVIRHIAKGEATVHIRESHTDRSLAGQASFIAPAKAAKKRATTRGYTRSSVVTQHEPDDPDPDDDDNDGQDSAGSSGSGTQGSGTQADEMEARGFTETRSDDDDDDDDSEDEDEDLEDDED